MGRIISIRDLYAAERAVKQCNGIVAQAAQKLGVSEGAVRIRLDRLKTYRKERAEERQAQQFDRMPTANISTLQSAPPEHFEVYVNEILSGERLYSPVKSIANPSKGSKFMPEQEAVMSAVAEMKAADKGLISREINRAIEIKQQIDELTSQLKDVNAKIYGMVEGKAGLYRSNRGHCEIKIANVLTIPERKQAQLAEVLGERYPDLVEETLKLGAKSGLRRLIFEPGPHEVELSKALQDIVSIQERPSFAYKGA